VPLVIAHDGYPRWLGSGADFLEVDIRRNAQGEFVLAHDAPRPESTRLGEAIRSDAPLQLDLKESGYEIELMSQLLNVRFVVTTPHRESIERIKSRFPRVKAGLTRTTPERSGADFLALDQRYVDDDALSFCERLAIPVWIWTVDDAKLLKRWLADMRIAAVITNRPALALRIRSGRA
jgi:glycerophosphoryl diester phosphodiesterase